MAGREVLYRELALNNGVITTERALAAGITKDLLKRFVELQELVRLANGLYALPNEAIDEYIYFTHRIQQGIFSHETAAYLHGICTRMPLNYVMTVKVGDNVSRVKAVKENVIFKYCRADIFSLGQTTIVNPFGREVPVYNRERTILDLIKDKKRVDEQVFSEALKSYFASEDKDLLQLSKYAKDMKMESKVRMYLEVLL